MLSRRGKLDDADLWIFFFLLPEQMSDLPQGEIIINIIRASNTRSGREFFVSDCSIMGSRFCSSLVAKTRDEDAVEWINMKTKLTQRRFKAQKSSACGLCKPWKKDGEDKKTVGQLRKAQDADQQLKEV